MKAYLAILLTVWMLPGLPSANENCLVIRGVFDVGSGATKAHVNSVDVCLQKIEKSLFLSSEKVSYKQSLVDNHDEFPASIMEEGQKAILKLKKSAESDSTIQSELKKIHQKSIEWRGIATSAFRQAKNGPTTLEIFNKRTDITFKILPQKDEAMFGYIVGSSLASDPSKALVWDIGGGSQQMTFRKNQNEPDAVLFEIGAESVKNKIIESVLKKDPKTTKSPNPIGKKNLSSSQKTVSDMFPRKEFKRVPKTIEVIGIGGVHQFAIPKATGKEDAYSLQDASKAIENLIDKDDAALNDKYADTQVTNLLLVEAILKRLPTSRVKICKYGIADGYMLVEDNWTNAQAF